MIVWKKRTSVLDTGGGMDGEDRRPWCTFHEKLGGPGNLWTKNREMTNILVASMEACLSAAILKLGAFQNDYS